MGYTVYCILSFFMIQETKQMANALINPKLAYSKVHNGRALNNATVKCFPAHSPAILQKHIEI